MESNPDYTLGFTKLSAWLEVATKGLCLPAKERVAHEFWQHYREAISERAANGESIDAAHDETMRELGKANEVKRTLRQVHFTEREWKSLNSTARSSFTFWASLAFCWMVYEVFHSLVAGETSLNGASNMLLGLFLFVSEVLCPNLCRKGTLRRALLWSFLAHTVLIPPWVVTTLLLCKFPPTSAGFVIVTVILGLFYVWAILEHITILRKLGKNAWLQDELQKACDKGHNAHAQ